ncbi:MAG TPA: c-type cytochrome [Bryobacterales bacterium]|nr:c-type cytochrome [Bryobacterales bacterium]
MLNTVTWLAAVVLVAAAPAQQRSAPPKKNPLGSSEQAVREGREIYNRSCTGCHGLNGAAGERGPALAGGRDYVRSTDGSIFEAVQTGIPGTQMPPSGLETMDIWKVVAYIRSLRASASDAFVPGDAAHGEQVFWGKGGCNSCHMIAGRGSILGPDLSNTGGERTLKEIHDALTQLRPQIPDGYRPAEVVTAKGRRFSGIIKNEDNFSLQLLDSHEQLQLFTRDELRDVRYKDRSLMPSDYDKRLSPAELQDLLAFLSRQARYKVKRPEDEEGER